MLIHQQHLKIQDQWFKWWFKWFYCFQWFGRRFNYKHLSNTGVSNGTYGSTTTIPNNNRFKGRRTSASTINVEAKAFTSYALRSCPRFNYNKYVESITFNKDDGFTVNSSGTSTSVGLSDTGKL